MIQRSRRSLPSLLRRAAVLAVLVATGLFATACAGGGAGDSGDGGGGGDGASVGELERPRGGSVEPGEPVSGEVAVTWRNLNPKNPAVSQTLVSASSEYGQALRSGRASSTEVRVLSDADMGTLIGELKDRGFFENATRGIGLDNIPTVPGRRGIVVLHDNGKDYGLVLVPGAGGTGLPEAYRDCKALVLAIHGQVRGLEIKVLKDGEADTLFSRTPDPHAEALIVAAAVDGAEAAVDDGVLVVIPARLAATRLPRKPLLRRSGKYLVEHVWERACRIEAATAVLVATDSQEIADAVASFGGEAVLTSPECASGTDRVAEAARGRSESVVVNLQGDEPEFDVEDVERLVAAMIAEPSVPMGTIASPAEPGEIERPSVVKVVRDRAGRALYFSRAPIPHLRDSDTEDAAPVLRHVGIYAFRRTALADFARLPPTQLERTEKLEQLRALENGWAIQVVIGRRAPPGIDTASDYEDFLARIIVGGEGTVGGGGGGGAEDVRT